MKQGGTTEPVAPRSVEGDGTADTDNADACYAQLMNEIMRDFGLSTRHARFVVALAASGNASAAYRRAGYQSKSPDAHASRLAVKDSIRAATERLRAKLAEQTGYAAEEALQFVADLLRADPRELMAYRRNCCRFCHGTSHWYQRTKGEMEADRAKHAATVARRQKRNKGYVAPEFNEQGGDGFDSSLDPHPDCPSCGGDGVGRLVIKDTRSLSREATALYAGVRVAKGAAEVKMHDKMAAIERMFQHHGLYEADNKLSATEAADPAVLIALSEAMEQSRLQYAATMEHRRRQGFYGD